VTQRAVEGILFGLALGDALGWPTEFVTSWAELDARFGRDGLQEPPDPAVYTDDTQMTLALCEGLLNAGLDAGDDALMSAIGDRFVAWAHSPENNRAPGNTVMAGLARIGNCILQRLWGGHARRAAGLPVSA
jgi:ADP-ribosylglycohydrolase